RSLRGKGSAGGRLVPAALVVLGRHLEYMNLQLLYRIDEKKEDRGLGGRGPPLIDRKQRVGIHGEMEPHHFSVVIVGIPVEMDPEGGRVELNRRERQLCLGVQMRWGFGWSGSLRAACREDESQDE